MDQKNKVSQRDWSRLRTWPTLGFIVGLVWTKPASGFGQLVDPITVLISSLVAGAVLAIMALPCATLANRWRGPTKTGFPSMIDDPAQVWATWLCAFLATVMKMWSMYGMLSIMVGFVPIVLIARGGASKSGSVLTRKLDYKDDDGA